ncbi:putative ATP synthase subunit f, mitochondrial [Tubulanus polymorphus]|uniref:putative ATP synthase subunit f, mitochondrial n=1 Tax=Tubulanus polymorphus TaxID=672921 RepID=UPI003DA2F0A9
MGFGEYPAGYNPKVHGAYNPARSYGRPDTTLGETKIGELGSWLSRRSYNPQTMLQAVNRNYWKWAQKWVLVKKTNLAPFIQMGMIVSFGYYFYQYRSHTNHRHAKYH